ncbi:MAG: phosphate transport system permease protein [Rubritalea sp.]|jgi:phosphate transport system permease protein|tara:strand:+ start:4001 stop:6139 length:2139 start_codon:yes stop_codon:yes gene_type:complete
MSEKKLNQPSSDNSANQSNPFSSRKSNLRTKERIAFGSYAFATYFIIICASFIFGKILINGLPVLWNKGFSFVSQKPQTLSVLEIEKGSYTVPTENFDNMLLNNPDELAIGNLEDFEKSFAYKTFKIDNGSIIGEGYLKEIEKENKGYYLRFAKRDFATKSGFSVATDKKFNIKKEELAIIQQHDPGLIKGEITEKVINLNKKKVTIKAGEYDLSKNGHDALIPTELVFQMKQSFPDDEPEKINTTIIPKDQTITVTSAIYNQAFDEDERGTIPVAEEVAIPYTVTFNQFTLPAAKYKVSAETLKVLSNYGIKHLHNPMLGSIVVNDDDDEKVTLNEKQFKRLVNDNPKLILSQIEDSQQNVSYTKFDLQKDSEIQLNFSDFLIFKKDKNFSPSSEKTHSYSGGGILGPIIGTACLVIICMTIALFTGIAAATYLNEYARKGGFTRIIRLAMLNLAGVPSIVFGLFGLGLFVMIAPVFSATPNVESKFHVPIVALGSAPDLRTLESEGIEIVDSTLSTTQAVETANLVGAKKFYNGWYYISFQGWGTCMLAGGFTLAIMVLPVIITSCEESLKAVPMGFREAAMALGATKWQSIRTAVLPYAFPGILTASILGITRVAGETAPIMFTAAAAEKSDLPWQGIHSSGFSAFVDFLQQSVQALPYHIYTVAGRIPQSEYTQPMQYGSVLVFMIIVFMLSAVSIYLRIKIRNRIKW